MRSLAVLRLVAVLHAVAICAQPVAIGIYLNGATTGLKIHEPVGIALAFVGLTQLIAALVYWRRGGRPLAPLIALLILAAEAVQIAMGFNKQLTIHIPLGIALIGSTVGFAIWICRRRTVSA
ncbi:hypothetical protein E1263_13555 [Kribbella antibiotica]|uniref:Uncharacterized protein n=1 Tax=Kribbella antibiotica TaxID=190195 RepID=A0A4R4ZNC6_9ACTN|nr:hypothetical protein [Kribbella antibiotica]TDD59800.1 hypothetical protein E1263_13555 [Kribbella antibiotica]